MIRGRYQKKLKGRVDMYRYEKLRNTDNVLVEVADGGSITVEDVSILLGNISVSYASNILRKLWGRGYLKRKNINKGLGNKKFRYDITSDGIRRVGWLRKKYGI
jgi:predicted transcriptional regulator